MANKNKQTTQKKAVQETWRKPLNVPPRSNAMRNFYQGSEETSLPTDGEQKVLTPKSSEDEVAPPKLNLEGTEQKEKAKITEKKDEKVKVEAKSQKGKSELQNSREQVVNSNTGQPTKLSAEDLSNFLGFEIEDLFDVNELLRGKSLEIYQTLLKSSDEKGRCKITQPELMKRTGIKNRRTFYKHEQWLINLRLLEKRHLPGDHKGVVYRIFKISEVLPVPSELVEQFEKIFKDSE
jgi:hypothetical protein